MCFGRSFFHCWRCSPVNTRPGTLAAETSRNGSKSLNFSAGGAGLQPNICRALCTGCYWADPQLEAQGAEGYLPAEGKRVQFAASAFSLSVAGN